MEKAKQEAADISEKIAASLRGPESGGATTKAPEDQLVVTADEARILQRLLETINQDTVDESIKSLGISPEQAPKNVQDLAAKIVVYKTHTNPAAAPALDFTECQELWKSFGADDGEEQRRTRYEAAIASKRPKPSTPY